MNITDLNIDAEKRFSHVACLIYIPELFDMPYLQRQCLNAWSTGQLKAFPKGWTNIRDQCQ